MLLIALAAVGCQTYTLNDAQKTRIEAVETRGDSANLGAERAAIDAAQAEQNTARSFRELELRIGGLSGEGFSTGEGFDFAVRLPFDRPWVVDAKREAASAEVDVEIAALEQAAFEVEVRRCREGIAPSVYREERALLEGYRGNIEGVLEWNRAWLEAGELNELEAARLDLDQKLALSSRAPRPVMTTSPGVSLPSLTPPAERLDQSPENVQGVLVEHHPRIRTLEAESRRFEEEARAVEGEKLPWFRFVELSYQTGEGQGAENIEGKLSLEVPFGVVEDAEEERASLRALEKKRRAEQVIVRQRRVTDRALLALSHFEASAPSWRELLRSAEEAEGVALRWLAQREGDPRAVAQLLLRAHSARLSVLERQEQAATASCDLLEASGVPYSSWPRR